MKCIKSRCYSPVACGGWGYCRELNFNVGAQEIERLRTALTRIREVLRPADNAKNVETVGRAMEIASAATSTLSSQHHSQGE
jgi:hypothetical protein